MAIVMAVVVLLPVAVILYFAKSARSAPERPKRDGGGDAAAPMIAAGPDGSKAGARHSSDDAGQTSGADSGEAGSGDGGGGGD